MPPPASRPFELARQGGGCAPLRPRRDAAGCLRAFRSHLLPPRRGSALGGQRFVRPATGSVPHGEGSSKHKSGGNKPSRFLIRRPGCLQGCPPAERVHPLLPLHTISFHLCRVVGTPLVCSTSATESETSIFRPFP